MILKKVNKTLFAALLGSVLMVAGCGGGGQAGTTSTTSTTPTASTEKSVINIGLKADPPSLDPNRSTALVDRMVHNSMYDKLFDLDASGKIVPMLATVVEVSADGKTYTFKLKEGVKFHDGTEFNADAVIFNFERNMKDEKSKRKGELKYVESVTAVDTKTVKIQLKQPFAPFISILTDRSGMMVSPAAVKQYGEDYLNHPVGTGPYVFVEQVKGDHVSLKKNEQYWNGQVKVEQLNYKVFTNGTAKVQNLRSGMLDIIDEVPAKEIQAIKGDSNLAIVTEPGMGFMGIHLNLSKEPFTNQYLRLAVDRAIDREAVVKVLFNGYALPGNSPFAPGSLAYGDNDKPKKPEPTEIKDLLAKGGKANGFNFKLQISTSPENEQFGAIIQSMLKQYNINVELEKVEFGTMIENGDNGNFEALQLGWSGRPDPDQNFYDFVVTDMPNNDGRISFPELDDLAAKARTELDETKRKAYYDEAIKIMHDQAAYTYVYHQYNLLAMNKKISGFTYVPDGLIRTATLEKK